MTTTEHACRDCDDTGLVGKAWGEYCWCPVGRTLRADVEAIERAQEPIPEGQMTLNWSNSTTLEAGNGSPL